MRKWLTRSIVPFAVASTMVMAGSLTAAQATGHGHGHSHGATPLHAKLDGKQEIPGPGDDNGRGNFVGIVKGDRLCYLLVATKVGTATAAHIHAGPVGVAGGIVVELETPNKVSFDCIKAVPDAQNSTATLSTSELAAIVDEPSNFYVNVHNAAFPTGAIRGQLR